MIGFLIGSDSLPSQRKSTIELTILKTIVVVVVVVVVARGGWLDVGCRIWMLWWFCMNDIVVYGEMITFYLIRNFIYSSRFWFLGAEFAGVATCSVYYYSNQNSAFLRLCV